MSVQERWQNSEALERITDAYKRDDRKDLSCPQCGGIERQHSKEIEGNVVRESSCINCSYVSRVLVVEATPDGFQVKKLPSDDYSTDFTDDMKPVIWLLLYDCYHEVKKCR
jgi:ssDNA-binding Zn-finger/Zn-ribbon topoisomerase 1